uniref:neurogenic locus notch homolog protein 2-like isoform X1 n=1 Tax=Styela clava TaxID=7725 RepID=UPI00193AD423|nr:neurogenic locus notch homolog protein 2-like isoform X1 [Styela clava]
MFSSNQSICNIILIILTSTYSTEGKACAEQRCLNGGTCINNICICTKEWKGDNCEKQVKMECSELEGCNHGGTCVDAVCQCTRLWTGGNCDTNVHDTVFYQGYMTFESHRYSFIPDPSTYSDAQKQCQKLGGRVITEPFSSSKQRALSALVKQYLPETEDSWMWVGRLQGTDKCTTIPPDFATNNSQNSCDNKFSYVCERPLKGACFQEVADEYCSDNEDGYCHQSLSGIVCCKENFKMLANGSCVDINECQTNSELCSFTFGKCDNEPGSYRCLCDEGMQGNGIDSCGYIISLTQLVNYTELTMPAPERKIKNKENRLRDLYNKGLTLKIEKLSFTSITELENKQFNITFNIYSKDKDFTPTALIEDYMKVKLKMLETAPNKLMFVGWEKPKPGSLTCLPTKMGIGDDRFHFHNASANSFSVSKEKCSNGLPQAVVKCNVRKFGDGTEIAFYDYTTLERNPCGTPTSVEEWTTRMKIGGKDEKRDALLSLTEFVNEDKTRKISDAGLKDVVDIADSLLSNDENSETPDTDKKSSEQNKI